MKKLISACLLFLFSAGFVFAQQSTNEALESEIETATNIESGYLADFDWGDGSEIAPEETTRGGAFWSAVKVIFFTALLVALAVFIIRYIAKKGGVNASEESGIIEVLVTQSVGLGNYLAVAKVGPAYYLISFSADGVRLLDRIEEKETIDYLEVHREEFKPEKRKNFSDVLSSIPGISKNSSKSKIEFIRKQKDKIEKF